jgi:oxygen-independent coproporphyrinogen-3 oxidase
LDAINGHDHQKARSLYIHIPFCSHKCHYCDFYSFVDNRDRQEAFAARLMEELRAISPAADPLQTIFIGGGTPSLLRVELWTKLLKALHTFFDLSGLVEFSVECNPESVSKELMCELRAGGVNRISMGAQSFQPEHLATLERLHNPDRIPIAMEHTRSAGIDRVSIDLIYAIPGQNISDLESDLDTALALPIEHISCYELTYEPNTAMTKRLERGEFDRSAEELEIEMFELVGKKVQAAGLVRYEVSNYAMPGAECLHNLMYWRQEGWLASGPSASAHVAGHRYKNVPRLESYLSSSDEGFSPIVDLETPNPVRLIQEKIMTGLRLSEGIDGAGLHAELESQNPEAAERLMSEALGFENLGQLICTGSRWSLTETGLLVADGIASDLMAVIY